jgi:hypothetical protein
VFSEEESKKENYTEKNSKEYIRGRQEELSDYIKDTENRQYLEKMNEIWSSGTQEIAGPDITSRTYEREKESEEYKREEQLKEMINENIKRKEKEEEYKRRIM